MELFFIFHPSGRFYDFPSFLTFFFFIFHPTGRFYYFLSFLKMLLFSTLMGDFIIFHSSGRFYYFPSFQKIFWFSILQEYFMIFHPSGTHSFILTHIGCLDKHTEVEIACLIICSQMLSSFLNRKWNYWCKTC